MPKMDWFDDFMVMKMMEEDEADTTEPEEASDGLDLVFLTAEETAEIDEEEEDYEPAELLEALQEELSVLQDELLAVECNEPSDSLSDAFSRWEARRDLLESQIYDIETAIQDLE